MAATRLVEELVDREADYHVTVLGDEPEPAYNRVLLSAVLEGSHPADAVTLRSAEWYDDRGVELVTGSRAVAIDRVRRVVTLADRRRFGYDRLVLATGAAPRLPTIRGLLDASGALRDTVHTFRSLDDCRRLSAAVRGSQSAVVVGGGLLGVQVTCALAERGLDVAVVEARGHVLAHHLGAAAGAVVRRQLERTGIDVHLHARPVGLTDGRLTLDDGCTLGADLVVVAVGARPRAGLAARAGLRTRCGVVVDDALTSVTDDRVHAIGDCAEHAGQVGGFLPGAWEQARVLADVLTGPGATYQRPPSVVRLRATGLGVAVLGDPEHTDGGVIEVTNPVAGSYRKAVVRDRVLSAAVLVGDLSRVGLLTGAYDRRTVLGPDEPGQLLMPEPPVGQDTAPALPDHAEVCACAGVSAGRVRTFRDLPSVAAGTRATTGCGGCRGTVESLLGTSGFSSAKHGETSAKPAPSRFQASRKEDR